MAVSTTDTYSGPYEANGVTVEFPFTFKAVSRDDVGVFIRDAAGNDTVVSDSDYSVTLVAEGGTVTMLSPPSTGSIFVFSEPSFLQPVNFASGQPFLPSVVNDVNDRDVVRALYLKREIDRAPKVPIGGGAEGKFPVVGAGGGWGFASGTGNDPALRSDLADPELGMGLALAAFKQIGDNSKVRTGADKLLDLPLDRRDFIDLQAAVNAAGESGRALYLGDEEFEQETTVILPDADLCIYGPGSGALIVTFSGTGGLFVAENLSAATNIDIGGFTALAGAPNCGRPVSIEYTVSTGINVRAVRIFDLITDMPEDATSYWSGGPYLNNARNSVIEESYTRGAYDSLTKTVDGLKIGGEATDVKISNFQVISVGTGIDIVDQAEGTIITGYVAVDVNIGVSKVHIGTSEPWLTMTNWHINSRKIGILLDNVLQTTITPGLIYCQNGEGDFIGIKITGGTVANQDMKIGAIVDVQLGGAGMSSSTGIRIDQGNGIVADLLTRDVQNPVWFGSLSYNNIITLAANSYARLIDGPNKAGFGNRLFANDSTLGYFMPSPSGPFNPDSSSASIKANEMLGWGADTVGAVKGVGGIRFVSKDANWVAAQAEIYARMADTLVRMAVFDDKAILFDRLLSLNFANDAAAAAGGVPVGGLYHNAGAPRVRLS